MEIIDLTLTWLPFLKVPKNALELAKVTGKLKGFTTRPEGLLDPKIRDEMSDFFRDFPN